MKTVSEQLKEMGLKHGDMCEIENVPGRCLVVAMLGNELEAVNQDLCFTYSSRKVICGWRAAHACAKPLSLKLYYTIVFPKPVVAPLPEAVDKAIDRAFRLDADAGWREIASAIIAECKK